MAFEIEWLKGAQDELNAEIAFVLGEFGLFAARKAYQRIKTNVNHLENFPLIGIVYPGTTYKGCEVRKLVIRHVTVFYSPQPDRVTIIAIWNNYQNSTRIPDRLSNSGTRK
jgi:plasmid stabilization system protein ParE